MDQANTLPPAMRSRIISNSLPNAAPALAMRGLCEFEIGDYEPSLKDIQRALALGAANQPRNEKILRYHEALLLTRTGRFEDALRSYAFFTHDEDSNPELTAGPRPGWVCALPSCRENCKQINRSCTSARARQHSTS